MPKNGPCCHCGVTSTPLWRNGPSDKPVLCNACGSRWRTKGSLVNYTPLHSRAEPGETKDYRVARMKNSSVKNKEATVIKRKLSDNGEVIKRVSTNYNHGLQRCIDEENTNRSSSGSAMSNSDGCVQFDSADTSDLTGPSQSIVWDSTIPSRKRTCVSRPKTPPSTLERLTKDLYTIYNEQQSSLYSGSCEEDLLFESDMPMVSVEIGHGSVLIQHPSFLAKEEESVASSFPVDKNTDKSNEAYSRLSALSVHSNNNSANVLSPEVEKGKKAHGLGIQPEQIKREKNQWDVMQILGSPKSPLCFVDLKDVVNSDVFERCLTIDEKEQLLKYLHSVDSIERPESLKDLFGSAQFKENISSFQKLLAEGILDLSFPERKAEDYKTLRRLALGNSLKSKWVEQYVLLKEIKSENYIGGSVVQEGSNTVTSGYSTSLKRPRDSQFHKFSGAKPRIKSPPSRHMKGIYEHSVLKDNDETCFSPKTLFMSPPSYNNSLMSNSFHYMDSSDQDLLLEVPCSGSFPEAELLLPSSSFGGPASTSSSSIYQQLVRPR